MSNILKVIIIILMISILGLGGYFIYSNVLKKEEKINPIDYSKNELNDSFTFNLIKQNHMMVNSDKNYLISPYSIEIALNMLRDGASGETKNEIDKVIGTRKINDVTVKDRVSVANAIFIKDKYEKNILTSYKNNLKNNYNAEMIIDEFVSPDKINDWVNEKTNGMIPKILDNIDPYFVLGLANALAIDVEWMDEFECNRTTSEEFTKADGTKINVEMMHKNDENISYIKTDKVDGVILPYQKYDDSDVLLEFVGLIPKDGINNYIVNQLESDLKNLNSFIKKPIEKEQIVYLSLPRFTYDSGIDNFKLLLQDMRIIKAFSSEAEFNNMVENIPEGVYVSEAIHKTHIELMEKGTKAAAVTYFGIKANGVFNEKEEIDIKFNKPFIYLIREKNTNEILFFGIVNEPNLWSGTTCSN